MDHIWGAVVYFYIDISPYVEYRILFVHDFSTLRYHSDEKKGLNPKTTAII